MQSIGDRLREARERQGISIREAAEGTKIRQEFLVDFESNNFNQELPDIYKRGFMRLYGRYLGLDGDRMVADYYSAVLGYTPVTRRGETRDYIGRMDVGIPPSAVVSDEEDYDAASAYGTQGTGPDFGPYLKVGIIVAAVVLFVVVTLGVMALLRALAGSGTPAEVVETPPAAVVEQESKLTLRAVNSHNTVVVRQKSDMATLYSGTLRAGQEVTVVYRGQISINTSEAQNLLLIEDGRERRLAGTGFKTYDYPPR